MKLSHGCSEASVCLVGKCVIVCLVGCWVLSILHQLFTSQPRLIRYALPSYREVDKALSTIFPKLWSIFIVATIDLLAGNVVCVLDALDEYDEQEQLELTKALKDFCLD